DRARQTFNLTLDQRPALIAFPEDAADVAAAVRFAAARGLRVAPRRTGHNAGPLPDLDDTLLLRTDNLREVHIDAAARQARGGAPAPVAAGRTWCRPPRSSVWPRCTARRPTSRSPATRWAAAWAGTRASTAWRATACGPSSWSPRTARCAASTRPTSPTCSGR